MTTNNGPDEKDPATGGRDQRPHATLDLEASEVSSRPPAGSDEANMRSDEDAASEALAFEASPAEGSADVSDGGMQGFLTHMAAGGHMGEEALHAAIGHIRRPFGGRCFERERLRCRIFVAAHIRLV